jgi:hypothetical protein
LEDHLMGDVDAPTASLSRRHLFGLGATSVGFAVLVAACGNDEDPAPGRVGNAPEETDLPTAEVNDVVYLRTLTSLEYSILGVYEALSEIDGLDEDVTALLNRLSDDHNSAADTYAELTSAAGGEPYECPNSWLMRRTLQPVLDHIIGVRADGTEIPPSDDPTRDALATADALETIAAATAQQYVERLADPATRAEVITVGTAASRRAATAALDANPPPEGYVSPALTDGEEVGTDEQGFVPQFAIPSRFGQLTPVTLQVGAADDAGQRFTINIETPAENAYVYEGQTCPA